jgi:hypothetical protein
VYPAAQQLYPSKKKDIVVSSMKATTNKNAGRKCEENADVNSKTHVKNGMVFSVLLMLLLLNGSSINDGSVEEVTLSILCMTVGEK